VPNIYSVVAWGNPVGQGATGTYYVELAGYAKRNSPEQPYLVANEYVASRIGQLLGLPVPPGAIIEGQQAGERGWVTLAFADSKDRLPPINPSEVVRDLPSLAAGVFVFDLLIANTDRHTGNLSYLPSKRRLDVFDHSHALFGNQLSQIPAHLNGLLDDFAVYGHCLLGLLSRPNDIIGRVEDAQKRVGEVFLREICREVGAAGVGVDPGEATRLYGFLMHRRDNLRALVDDHRHHFKSIPVDRWGLN
jgi:HipA-like protein